MDEIKTPDLEIECKDCLGTGHTNEKNQYGGRQRCYACDGSGVIVTEFGKRLLVFVANHLDGSIRIRD